MSSNGWHYDEMRQVGVDFESVDQVAGYDARQGSSAEAEQRLLDRLGLTPGQVVVDIGCGTGCLAREAARSGASVRAVDVSRAVLDFVRDAARREKLPPIELEHAGFLSFRFEPSSADAVVSRFALHHLRDFWKQVALLRLHEVIRPGGLLYLRDVVFSFPPETYAASLEDWVGRMPEVSGFEREDFEMHAREEYSTVAWVIEGFLARAGFEILERDYSAPEYAEYLCRARK